MEFKEAMTRVARIAADATYAAMNSLRDGSAVDEDDLSGVLKGQLDARLSDRNIGGIVWRCSILRHRAGEAAQEKHYGADFLMQVSLNSPEQFCSKGIFVQAKKFYPGHLMSTAEQNALIGQCEKMLSFSNSSFVFNYTANGVRASSALKIKGARERDLDAACDLTVYHFYRDLFLCTIGDPNWAAPRSATLSAALSSGIDVIRIDGEGSLESDTRRHHRGL